MKTFKISAKHFLVLIFICMVNSQSFAQMRQGYVDNFQPSNEIYKISFYSPAEGYVAFRDWIGYTADSGHTFTKKYISPGIINTNGYTVNTIAGFSIKGVKAFNQGNIIAYGHFGFIPAILYSSDGGGTYTLTYYSHFNSLELSTGITDMVFPGNGNIGYAINADEILKTTNKGQSWSIVKTDPNSLFDRLEAIDDNNVYAISDYYSGDIQFPNNRVFVNNKVLKTTNAGTSWQMVSVPPGQVRTASFVSASNGFLNVNQTIFHTANGGSTWTPKNNPLVNPIAASKIHLVNDSTAYALNGLFNIIKTTDTGKIWETLPRNNTYSYLGYGHNDFQFITPNNFWAGGGHGFLEISTNGGGTPLPKANFFIDTTGVDTGSPVNLINYSKKGYQYKWFVNNVLVSTAYNFAYDHSMSNQLDSIKLIVIAGALADTITKYQYFLVFDLAAITSFTPASGSTGTFVTINGYNFTGVSMVRFGGVPASSFKVINDIKITAIVGAGATGTISVTHPHGTFATPGFTYSAPPSSPPPAISSITPQSGAVGATVVITGNNFGSTVFENTVFFGATKALIQSATAGQIVCTVPIGASFEPLSVLNTVTGLRGASFKPFNATFADSSFFTTYSFTETKTINLYDLATGGSAPKFIAGRDIDGDGKPDLITCMSSYRGDSIAVYKNSTIPKGVLSLEPKINVGFASAFPGKGTFDSNDLDGDGKPDIVAITNTTVLPILRNISTPGNMAFDQQVNLITPDGNQQVVIDDIDNDGRYDLCVASFNTDKLSVIRNTSAPGLLSFAEKNDYTSGGHATGLSVGDLDGDGKKDIVVLNSANNPSSNFSCFRSLSSQGNISFSPKTDFTIPALSLQGEIKVVDYDGDNKLDVIVISGSYYFVYRNISSIGNIAFAPVSSTSMYGVLVGGKISNLSGDTKPDIVSGNTNNRFFSIVKNKSVPGSISGDNYINIESATPTYSYQANTADFDLDGKMDVVISSSQDKIISIYKNNVGAVINSTECPGTNPTFSAGITGSSYQWQVDNGTGFINLPANYYGSNGITIQLTGVPTSWTGYKLRCLVDGNSGQTFTISFQNKWTGNVSNVWANYLNWSCYQVPDLNTDVIITSGSPIINQNTAVRSLKLSHGVVFTVNPGISFTITH